MDNEVFENVYLDKGDAGSSFFRYTTECVPLSDQEAWIEFEISRLINFQRNTPNPTNPEPECREHSLSRGTLTLRKI